MAATAAAAGPGCGRYLVDGVTVASERLLRVPRVVMVTAVPVAWWRAVVVPVVVGQNGNSGRDAGANPESGPMAAAAAGGSGVAVVVVLGAGPVSLGPVGPMAMVVTVV